MKARVQKVYGKIILKQNVLQSRILITLILLLAAGLYFFQLGTEALWRDEMYSIRAVTEETGIAAGTRLLSPLYILLLSIWMKLGTNSTWLRLLSVIFAIGSVFFLYQIGRHTVGEVEGLISALLLTLSPLFINHAQEVRFYTLGTFLSLGGTLALLYALERSETIFIAIWTFVRLLAILALPLNLTMLLPDFILIVWKFRARYRQLFAFGSGFLFILITVLPLIIRSAANQGDKFSEWYNNYPKPDIFLVGIELTHLTVYWPFKHLFGTNLKPEDYLAQIRQSSILSYFTQNFFQSNILWIVFYILITAILIVLLGVALVNLNLNRYKSLLMIAAWASFPLLTILVYSYLSDPIWKSRYLLFFSPYFLVILSVGFVQVLRWRNSIGITIAFLYLIAATNGLTHFYTTIYRALNASPT